MTMAAQASPRLRELNWSQSVITTQAPASPWMSTASRKRMSMPFHRGSAMRTTMRLKSMWKGG